MEVVYSKIVENKYFLNKNFIGFYGNYSDLESLISNLNMVKIRTNFKVRRYISYNEEYFKILNLPKEFLKKNISELSFSELKLLNLLIAIKDKAKIVYLDDFDLGFNSKYKKNISKFIKYINATLKINFIIKSKDVLFINKTCKHIIISKNKIIKYQGDLISAIKQGLIDSPVIFDFIDLANKKGANLSYTLDNKELLKDIYRSVF